MIDYKIRKKDEYPKDQPSEVVKYDVVVIIDEEKYEKGFNLDPEQELDKHVEKWVNEIKSRKS